MLNGGDLMRLRESIPAPQGEIRCGVSAPRCKAMQCLGHRTWLNLIASFPLGDTAGDHNRGWNELTSNLGVLIGPGLSLLQGAPVQDVIACFPGLHRLRFMHQVGSA